MCGINWNYAVSTFPHNLSHKKANRLSAALVTNAIVVLSKLCASFIKDAQCSLFGGCVLGRFETSVC